MTCDDVVVEDRRGVGHGGKLMPTSPGRRGTYRGSAACGPAVATREGHSAAGRAFFAVSWAWRSRRWRSWWRSRRLVARGFGAALRGRPPGLGLHDLGNGGRGGLGRGRGGRRLGGLDVGVDRVGGLSDTGADDPLAARRRARCRRRGPAPGGLRAGDERGGVARVGASRARRRRPRRRRERSFAAAVGGLLPQLGRGGDGLSRYSRRLLGLRRAARRRAAALSLSSFGHGGQLAQLLGRPARRRRRRRRAGRGCGWSSAAVMTASPPRPPVAAFGLLGVLRCTGGGFVCSASPPGRPGWPSRFGAASSAADVDLVSRSRRRSRCRCVGRRRVPRAGLRLGAPGRSRGGTSRRSGSATASARWSGRGRPRSRRARPAPPCRRAGRPAGTSPAWRPAARWRAAGSTSALGLRSPRSIWLRYGLLTPACSASCRSEICALLPQVADEAADVAGQVLRGGHAVRR